MSVCAMPNLSCRTEHFDLDANFKTTQTLVLSRRERETGRLGTPSRNSSRHWCEDLVRGTVGAPTVVYDTPQPTALSERYN